MSPKKQTVSGTADESDVTGITMSTEQFNMLISTVRETALQTNSDLLEQFNRSMRSSTPQIVPSQILGSFAKCTARFNGSETSDVDAFLDNVLTYKDICNVSNENALRGISMLLEGQASTWWIGVKNTLDTWDNAVRAFREAFSRKLPPYLIFREIFSRDQNTNESTENFVCRVRALLSQLPYDLPVEAQIDIVFGLLNRKIRKRLLRGDLKTFKDLMIRARDVERSLLETNVELKPEHKDEVKNFENKQRSKPRCSYCKNFGHVKDDCQKLKKKEKPLETVKTEVVTTTKPQLTCYGCGAIGVIKSKCPTCQIRNSSSSSSAVLQTNSLSFYQTSLNENNGKRPLLPITIDGVNGAGFADSGSQASIAGAKLYSILQNLGYKFESSVATLSYADGEKQTLNILKADVNVSIGGRQISLTFTVLPHLKYNNTLLGCDFLQKAQIVLDIPQQKWYFCDDPGKRFEFVPEPEEHTNREVCQVNTLSLRSEEGSNLNNDQREIVEQLLKENADIFMPGGGPTSLIEHRINTMDHAPISTHPYPLSFHKKEFLRQELDRLLVEGIIEECESPWASPVVLVPKNNNSYRLCVDYRRLNNVTVADTYPMPRLDELLQLAKPTPFMSTIDLQSGYWQVPVSLEDRDKTCFTTPFGTFRFTRMPFGLRNAPATFVRMMDRFRAPLGDRLIFAYLDDILVLSKTFVEHLEDLKLIFDRLRKCNLRARREKCTFVRNSVKYLGHIITPDGIKADSSKISAIKDMKPPRCKKHVQSFVQTCSWYRKFVPNFSNIARPLTDLLKKNREFQFGEKEMQAFELLKEALVSAPILIQANPEKPYVLRTDASDYALGAVLLQGEGVDERPIEFASRLLSSAERNYSCIEREALAVVWSTTEKFRIYLEGSTVTIATDHQPLEWLFSIKSPSGRLARWAMRIQGLNMKIVYTPGKMNVVADTLSRPICEHDTTTSCSICYVAVEFPSFGAGDFRQKQIDDSDLVKIITALEGTDQLEMSRWTERGYLMANGILYRWDPDQDTEEPQLTIPASLRKELLESFHDSATGGHYGVERTLQKIAAKYYFVGMRRFIADYIKNCVECQRYKATNLKPAGLLQTPAPSQRFEVISVDLFGPLPETPQRNKWILIVEDVASKWVELFSLEIATAEVCAKVLINEIILRFGTPRKMISDNGVQFISDIMQKVVFCFGINSIFIPMYHPESNPVERKNRDLKTQLSILTQNLHHLWDVHIASIRYAINSTVCASTGYTPAYLTFGRELRAPCDTLFDFRQVLETDNFVPCITPYLRDLVYVLDESKETIIQEQDKRKNQVDQGRRPLIFEPGQKVLLRTHVLSNAPKGISSKFAPKRDGPYMISKRVTPTTYEVSSISDPTDIIGKYHLSDLTEFREAGNKETSESAPTPLVPKKKRGRPRKKMSTQ